MKRLIVTGVVATLAACQGQIIEPGGSNGVNGGPNGGPNGVVGDPGTNPGRGLAGVECNKLDPGLAPMRRLSHAEYRNTVEDLFGNGALADQAVASFTAETESLGFRNNARFLQVNSVGAQNYMDAAEEIAKVARTDASILPCTPASGNEKACATQFIQEFGKKAYRRPLTAAEVTSYEGVYDKARESYPFEAGIEWIVFTMLQSPHFLNRVEFGSPPVAGKSFVRPTHYEMASRLSYLLWQSMPDDELFQAAAGNKLGTDAEIADQTRRMLADPRAKRIYQFFDEWLDVDEVSTMERDPNVFPTFNGAMRGLFAQETKGFVENVLWEGDASFETLMSGQFSFLNAELAQHYGVTGPTGSDFVKVDMPGRAGVITQAGVLAVHDKPTRTSIVLRGLKMRTDILCQTIGAPPADIVLDLPEVTAGVSQRQRLEEHRKEPLCAKCHDKMDPMGLVLDGFDALGRPRTEDEFGNPIDTNSVITDTLDANGPVANAAEFAVRLAHSQEVRDCFATQSFRFFYGRAESKADACTIKQLTTNFEKSNYTVTELIVALTQTDAFLYRRADAGAP